MRQHHGGVGGQPAPVAGMHAARTQIDHQVEVERAARAGGDGRHIRHHARSVAADQHVRLQLVPMRRNEIAQADRAAFLAGLQHQLQVEPEFSATLRQHRLQRGQVQRVLTLVVRAAAAIPAPPPLAIVFLGEPPRIEARAPLVLQSPHRIAMAVGQDRRPLRILDPFGSQDRTEAGARIGMDGDGEAHAFQPRRYRRIEVALHVGLVSRVLRGAGDRHQFGQPVAEAVAVEEIQSACNSALTCSHRSSPHASVPERRIRPSQKIARVQARRACFGMDQGIIIPLAGFEICTLYQ